MNEYYNDDIERTETRDENTESVAYYAPIPNERKKRPLSAGKALAVALAVMLTVTTALGAGLIKYTTDRLDSIEASVLAAETAANAALAAAEAKTAAATPTISAQATASEPIAIADAAAAAMPSIVAITSTQMVSGGRYYGFGGNSQYQLQGAGSGIIIGDNGTELYILTNNHVIDGADSLSVQFADGAEVTGRIKATSDNPDLAVVAVSLADITEETRSSISAAVLGSSDDLRIGQTVIAIGNALGYGQSVTAGIVSALGREITIDGETMTVLQTDAAINGGNSGGALINEYGEVVGVNVAKSSTSSANETSIEGMGYSIPISDAMEVIQGLMNAAERVAVDESERGYLGVTVYSVTANPAYGSFSGAYISAVSEDGAAASAGLREGDVITAIGGRSVDGVDELTEELSYYKAGDTVTVTAMVADGRSYTEQEFTVALGANAGTAR